VQQVGARFMSETPELITFRQTNDNRGAFAKPYSYAYGSVPFVVRELFWSRSVLGSVRGMHIQVEPAAAQKLIWVSQGIIHDVVVDVRPGPGCGHQYQFTLSADAGQALVIPYGFVHGFQALTDGAIVNYAQSHEFDPRCDTGVNWRSIDIHWPIPVTVTSQRDDLLPALSEFTLP